MRRSCNIHNSASICRTTHKRRRSPVLQGFVDLCHKGCGLDSDLSMLFLKMPTKGCRMHLLGKHANFTKRPNMKQARAACEQCDAATLAYASRNLLPSDEVRIVGTDT